MFKAYIFDLILACCLAVIGVCAIILLVDAAYRG